MEEEETFESSGVTESGQEANISRNHSVKSRHYREVASNDSNEGTFKFFLVKFLPCKFFFFLAT